jgi:hypothetical protein
VADEEIDWAKEVEEATAALQAEMDQWTEEKINPRAWRIGDDEILIRTEILVMMDVIMDRLDVSSDELDARLKRRLLNEFAALRPNVVAQRKREIQEAIRLGLPIRPEI